MFKNYIKVAYRNLLRHKSFSFINIAGLALGLTACLLIGLFVYDELQYDKFIPEGERVYRVYYKSTGSNVATTPPMFATTLQQEFPEVENTLRILNILQSKNLFEAGDQKFYEMGGILAEPTFFDFFPLAFQYGSADGALNDPGSIVISREMSQRFFGEANPVGKVLQMSKESFQVKGVFENNPKFHLPINYVLPLAVAKIPEDQMQSWTWYGINNYVKLVKGADGKALETKFQKYVAQNAPPILNEARAPYLPFFQPLHDIHLHAADFEYDMAQKGNITYVNTLCLIGVFILLIACFNFVNLATAKSLQRAREVGVRKTIGASRGQLILQFLGETVLLNFISIIFASALTSLLLPSLNVFTGKSISFNIFQNPFLMVLLFAMTLAVGVLAGFYPALFLSAFKPVKALKGAIVSHGSGYKTPWLRHGLVVVQFSLSVLLIISAVVVNTQVNFLHNKQLGFNKEQIMFFSLRGDKMRENYETFKHELLRLSGVSGVSVGYGFPGDSFGNGPMKVQDGGETREGYATQMMVDYDYLKVLGLDLAAGRFFSRNNPTDQDKAFLINETAAREYGLGTPEQALGKTLLWNTWANPDSVKEGKVIGVVKDFHFKSLHEKVEPAVLQIYPNAYGKVAVKLKSAEMAKTIQEVKGVWDRFSPDYPIEYVFMDENFAHMYQAEDKLKSLLTIFTSVAIFIACLGLFGLASYAAERRKKEIGIRKILGANVMAIVALLNKEFMKLIVVAAIIAFPLAWYAMQRWLQDFAYRIEIPIWAFLAAGTVAAAIAFVTVSFHAIKAATTNPVRNLRVE
ncbi:MAG: ABC transporter permease [Rufibacter sp.]